MFYPEIINRYVDILLKENDNQKIKNNLDTPTSPTSLQHLVWMLLEIKNSTSMSETKKHRWLGFVQGCMVSSNLISVEDEREFTRDIFAGK